MYITSWQLIIITCMYITFWQSYKIITKSTSAMEGALGLTYFPSLHQVHFPCVWWLPCMLRWRVVKHCWVLCRLHERNNYNLCSPFLQAQLFNSQQRAVQKGTLHNVYIIVTLWYLHRGECITEWQWLSHDPQQTKDFYTEVVCPPCYPHPSGGMAGSCCDSTGLEPALAGTHSHTY